MMDDFWAGIDSQLDRIEAEKPDTVAGVVAILGPPFFAGSGGDRSLFSALAVAGWRRVWAEASYFYVARHDRSGAVLTYIEGDVYDGDRRPVAETGGES